MLELTRVAVPPAQSIASLLGVDKLLTKLETIHVNHNSSVLEMPENS